MSLRTNTDRISLGCMLGGFLFALSFLALAPTLAQTPAENAPVLIRATRIAEPIRVDGQLDEEVYGSVQPITKFVQQLPRAGEPASERTEAWVLFDDTNIYITCRCWTERPDR